MIAIVGSQFARSVFDEPGAMGGIISGTNMAETDWISHSFDVFFEKKPACRLTDKLFMNHRNTVNMSGLCQNPLKENVLESKICDAICKCRNRVAREFRQKIKMFTEAPAIGLAQELLGRFLGVNSELPKTGDKVKTGELIQEKSDGRSTFPGGPQSPASVKYAVREVARDLGKGEIVIWDLIVLRDPALDAEWDNIEQIIEIKFHNITAISHDRAQGGWEGRMTPELWQKIIEDKTIE